MLLGSSGRQLNPCCLGRQGAYSLGTQGIFFTLGQKINRPKSEAPKLVARLTTLLTTDATVQMRRRRRRERERGRPTQFFASVQFPTIRRRASSVVFFCVEMTQSWIKVLLVTIFLIKTSAAWKGRSLECWQCAAIPGSRSFFHRFS